MQETFRLKHDLSLKEYLSLTFSFFAKGKLVKRYAFFLFILMALTIILGILTVDDPFTFSKITPMILSVAILFFILTGIFCLFSIITYYGNIQKFKNAFYSITHWGITKEVGNNEYPIPWRDATKYKETDLYFIIYMAANNFIPIQKNMFANEHELNNFRQFINDKLPATKA